MSWNYRIVKYRDTGEYRLHEVYYNGAGEAWSMTEEPAGFCGEMEDEVIESLQLALAAALAAEVFEEPEVWADALCAGESRSTEQPETAGGE